MTLKNAFFAALLTAAISFPSLKILAFFPNPPKEIHEETIGKGHRITPALGGAAGNHLYSHYFAPGDFIAKVTVWSGSAIDAVHVETHSGVKWTIGVPNAKGENAGDVHTNSFTLTKSQYLKSIKVHVGQREHYTVIKGIAFDFEGLGIKAFGEQPVQTLSADPGFEVIGFWGWYGGQLDSIGIITRGRSPSP